MGLSPVLTKWVKKVSFTRFTLSSPPFEAPNESFSLATSPANTGEHLFYLPLSYAGREKGKSLFAFFTSSVGTGDSPAQIAAVSPVYDLCHCLIKSTLADHYAECIPIVLLLLLSMLHQQTPRKSNRCNHPQVP